MKKSTCVLFLIIGWSFVFAQNKSYDLRLSTGTVTLAPNFGEARSAQPAKGEYFQGYYYRYIQFLELPSAEQKEAMAAQGVRILLYLPDNTYIAAIRKGTSLNALASPAVRSLHPIKPAYKMLPELQEAIAANNFPPFAEKGRRAGIIITYYENLGHEAVRSCLRSQGYQIVEEDKVARSFSVWVRKSRIGKFVALPFVSSAELMDDEPRPDNNVGRTAIRSNAIATDYSGGRKFNGSGVEIAIQDDGRIGPHIDYQGRIANQFMTSNFGDHGDHCSGIIMGAGNKDPMARGMAWGSNIHVYSASSYQAFSQINSHYNLYGIRIISTSYSDGCNAGYTTRAQQLDIQNLAMPELIHVFSAGNDGASNCNYGAGAGWGNVTGGHKHSKNSIAVANLTYLDVRNSSSSRGPAHDGRLKPEVSAVGTNVYSTIDTNDYISQTGTSMSCPAVAGLFAQLYQAYKSLNSSANPPSALMKAIVMNTAEDLGNPGPDFSYGYGRVNGLRAVQVLEQGAYLTSTVSNGATNSHTLVLPSGVRRIKVMTYWHDYQAQVNAAVALVNNLNTTISDPSSTVHNPLILDYTPNATNLNQNAVPGTDIRNNHEQITINNPSAGNYVLNVNGAAVPMGPQAYYVTWLIEMDGYTLTYPIGGEGFVPLNSETIRWDAADIMGLQKLEYTTNNGTTWNLITASIAGPQRHYNWNPPNVISGQCRVRISRGAYSAESDTNFSIISPPSNIQVGWACPDSIKLTWNPVFGATSYDVFKLGNTYMDSVATTTGTSCVLYNIPTAQSSWFSVRSRGPLNAVGRRAIAVEKKPGVKNCPQLPIDLALTQILAPSGTVNDCQNLKQAPVVINLYNAGTTTITGMNLFYRVNSGAVINEFYPGTLTPSASVSYTFNTDVVISANGTYNIKAWAKYAQDPEALNDTATSRLIMTPGTIKSLPFSEDFETFNLCGSNITNCGINCVLKNGFINESNTLSDQHDWRTMSGPPPTANTGPQTDFFPGTATGKYVYLESSAPCSSLTAKMLSPCFDLSSATGATLSFAYHMYGGSMGTMDLDIFANGAWTNSIWSKAGDQDIAWLIAKIDLSSWLQDTVTFRWRGTTAGGLSDMAIDAINIEVPASGLSGGSLSAGHFRVYPNPATGEFNVVMHSNPDSDLAYTVTDISGRVVISGNVAAKAGQLNAKINLQAFAAGVYTLRLASEGRVEYTKLYKI